MKIDFDIDNVPAPEFELIPEGNYIAQLINCEHKTSTTDMSNAMWAFCVGIIDGKYSGRRLFDNLNIYRGDNPQVAPEFRREPTESDMKTRTIAIRRLLEYKDALGLKDVRIDDTDELLQAAQTKPFLIKVIIQKSTGDSVYGDQNRIARVMPIQN
jgi:hypothetical protein